MRGIRSTCELEIHKVYLRQESNSHRSNMFSHKRKKEEPHTRNSDGALSQSKTNDILRTVPRDNAFHFYEKIGKPTNHVAVSLLDFRDKIKVVQWSSLVFHLKRKDFENWIKETIRDSELAKRISDISPNDFDLKTKLYETINTRINELRKMSSTSTVVHEDLIIAPRLSEVELSRQ